MTSRRPIMVSPLWLQGSILTFIVGFGFLSFSALSELLVKDEP
jgi:hypothetical protein